MSLSSLRRLIASALTSLLLAACGGGGSSAAPPVGGLTVDPGDGQVTISWTQASGVDYWLAYAAAALVTTDGTTPHIWAHTAAGSPNLTSPFVLSGLANGTTYAFSMNGRVDGGPGGAGTASMTAVPRPGGFLWNAGSTMGTTTMHAATFGTATDTTLNYIAVGDGGALYRGTDGRTWTQITTGPAAVDFKAAIYAFGKFIAAGAGGAVYSSADMATWTAGASTTTHTLNAMATNGGSVVAVGDAGTIVYSGDGLTWAAATTVPTTSALYGVAYTPSGLWLAVGANGTLLSSGDGNTWTSLSTGTTQPLRGVAATPLTSVITVTPGVTSYTVVGDAGTVLTSQDAATWTLGTGLGVNLTSVVGSSSQFLAVGASGAVFTSADGTTWTAQTSGTTANWQGLLLAQAQYIALSDAGANSNSH